MIPPEQITRVVLENGIVVLCRPALVSQAVSISGYLHAGALSDPDEKLGLADFTASALLRGAGDRSFQQIFDALESVGASVSFSGGTHTVGFGGRALAEDLDLVLGIIADALLAPQFPEEYVERLRAQFLAGLKIRAQDTGDMASLAFDQTVYAGHPYSRPEDGYIETVQAITRDDLVDFHRCHYGPRNMVVAVTGGIDPGAAVDSVRRALGGWINPLQPDLSPLPPLQPLKERTTRRVSMPGKSQADLAIGVAGPDRHDPGYMAASLGNNILGQFGMMGRIGDAVREQAGIAYYASSSLSGGPGPGPWDISAGVDPQNVDQAIDLILEEVERFVSEPVRDEELQDSQANYIGSLPLSLEANAGVARALINIERYDLGLDYYMRYPELILAVTPEDILETARRFLDPDRLAIAVAGGQTGV